jgi:hypothetical protein
MSERVLLLRITPTVQNKHLQCVLSKQPVRLQSTFEASPCMETGAILISIGLSISNVVNEYVVR